MTIREAEVGDLDAIADLAQDERIRRQGWDPDAWAMAPNARAVHSLLLRCSLGDGRTIALVATGPGGGSTNGSAGIAAAGTPGTGLGDAGSSGTGIAGAVVATVLPGATGTTWLVEELYVAAPRLWATVGRTLLAAVAARARQRGGTDVLAACLAADTARRAAMAGARLDLDCWFRRLPLDAVVPTGAPVDRADDDPGLPLPHVHAFNGLPGATSVAVDGGHALVGPSIGGAAPAGVAGGVSGGAALVGGGSGRGRTVAVADPVVGTGAGALWDALGALENTCRDRGDGALLVAVGPGEPLLDRVLDDRGYDRFVEWWTVHPTRAQLQPLVAPHSWQT